jgi:hypothetical protein
MKTPRRFDPTVQPLEERVALSLTFSGFIHSILPFIPDKSSAKKPVVAHAHVSPLVRKPVVGHAKHLYAGPLGKAPANSTAVESPATTAVRHPVATRVVRPKG